MSYTWKLRLAGMGAAMLGFGLAAGPALATPSTSVTFNFGTLIPTGFSTAPPNGGTVDRKVDTLEFTHGGTGTVVATITAFALNRLNVADSLTQRGVNDEESGLGVQRKTGDSGTQRETNKDEAIVLDYSKLLAAGGSLVSVSIGSLQSSSSTQGEGYTVFGSNDKPTDYATAIAGTKIREGIAGGTGSGISGEKVTVDLSGSQYKYITVTAALGPSGGKTPNGENDNVLGTTVVKLPAPVKVPEPASMALLGVGLLGLMGAARRRR